MRLALTREQRTDTYNGIRRMLNRFILDDRALASRLQHAAPDGYPTSSMPGPSGRGTISDRVGNTVIIRVDHDDAFGNHGDPAEKAFALLFQAARLFEQADSNRARAVPPTTTFVDQSGDDLWCSSCLRFGLCEPRSTTTRGRQDLCSWCRSEWDRSSKANPDEQPSLPPRPLVEAHHRGIRLTEAKRREILDGVEQRTRP